MIVPDTPRVPAPEVKTAVCWWESSVADGDLVAGVFEGGGAKGILYEGALRAMADRVRPRWFRAVAGSSAGAITALLVAAGLRPDDIARQAKAGLGTLRPVSVRAGLARLRSGRGYLSSTPLENWLVQVLQAHLEPAADGTDAGRVTFAQLHQRTGIELHVVTADLRSRRPMVFNYRKTPDEQVVPAVVASAAIPFVFDHHPSLLVDGGVSTNFPRFVFEDPSFRLEAGLDPMTAPVVGFLLDDSAAAAEGIEPAADPPGSGRRGLGWYAGRFLLLPLLVLVHWIPGLMRRNTTSEPPGYPRPKTGAARAALDILDGVIMFAVKPGIFVLTCLTLIGVTTVGAYRVVWPGFAGTLTDLPASAGAALKWCFAVVIAGVFSLIPVYALFIVLAMFTAGVHLWPTGRRLGYGLARTFLANPGAPSWAGLAPGDYVARLPVPRGLTIMASKLSDEETRSAQASAAAATAAVLDQLDNPAPAR